MFGADVDDALPELRAHAESLMVARCDIHRHVTTWNEATQKSVTSWTPVHLNVPCAFVTPPARTVTTVTDQSVTVEGPQVKIPVEFIGIKRDDRVTVTGFGVVWVTHVPQRTQQVQRRLECRWLQ